jgi:hypothetical protein
VHIENHTEHANPPSAFKPETIRSCFEHQLPGDISRLDLLSRLESENADLINPQDGRSNQKNLPNANATIEAETETGKSISSPVTSAPWKARSYFFSRGENDDSVSLTIASCSRSQSSCISATYQRDILLGFAHATFRERADDIANRTSRWSSDRTRHRFCDQPVERLPWGWYMALDPDSYGLTRDEESRGIVWCESRGCVNNYAGRRDALFAAPRLSLRCTADCPERNSIGKWIGPGYER